MRKIESIYQREEEEQEKLYSNRNRGVYCQKRCAGFETINYTGLTAQ